MRSARAASSLCAAICASMIVVNMLLGHYQSALWALIATLTSITAAMSQTSAEILRSAVDQQVDLIDHLARELGYDESDER